MFGPAVAYLESALPRRWSAPDGDGAAGPARAGVVRGRRLRRAQRDRRRAEQAARGVAARRRRSSPTALLHGAMRRQRDTATRHGRGRRLVGGPRARRGLERVRPPRRRGPRARRPRPMPPRSTSTDRASFQRAFEEATARWTGGEHDDEYDESWPAFVARAAAALDRACAPATACTVVVSSGGPIAVACAVLVDPDATAHGAAAAVERLQHRQREHRRHPGDHRLHRPPDADLQRALPPRARPGHLPLRGQACSENAERIGTVGGRRRFVPRFLGRPGVGQRVLPRRMTDQAAEKSPGSSPSAAYAQALPWSRRDWATVVRLGACSSRYVVPAGQRGARRGCRIPRRGPPGRRRPLAGRSWLRSHRGGPRR